MVFQFKHRTGLEFTGTPLIVDFNGDGKQEIVLFTNDGEMWVYDRNGKLLIRFPDASNFFRKSISYGLYQVHLIKLGIAVLSESGSLDAFLTSSSAASASLTWWQYLGDERHSNADASVTTSIPISTEFFPKSRVYNWPNPVYGQSTQITIFYK